MCRVDKKKVEVIAYDEEYSLPQKMYIMEQNKSENSYIVGSADFTSSGLGIVPSIEPLTTEVARFLSTI